MRERESEREREGGREGGREKERDRDSCVHVQVDAPLVRMHIPVLKTVFLHICMYIHCTVHLDVMLSLLVHACLCSVAGSVVCRLKLMANTTLRKGELPSSPLSHTRTKLKPPQLKLPSLALMSRPLNAMMALPVYVLFRIVWLSLSVHMYTAFLRDCGLHVGLSPITAASIR